MRCEGSFRTPRCAQRQVWLALSLAALLLAARGGPAWAANERSFQAFHSQGLAMHPPTQQQVDEIVSIASSLAQLTQKKVTFQGVLTLANSITSEFRVIRG